MNKFIVIGFILLLVVISALSFYKSGLWERKRDGEMDEWLVYRNEEKGFLIKHPEDWAPKIEEVGEGNSIFYLSKGPNRISISFLNAFGPMAVIFRDHPQFDEELDNPVIEKWEGEYVSIFTERGEMRRLVEPVGDSSENDSLGVWPVLSGEDSEVFVTVPPISYVAVKGDRDLLSEMDEILATLEFFESK